MFSYMRLLYFFLRDTASTISQKPSKSKRRAAHLRIFNLVLLNVASVRMFPIINTNVANWKLELATLTTLATVNNAGSVPTILNHRHYLHGNTTAKA